jgi:hypothetical protein
MANTVAILLRLDLQGVNEASRQVSRAFMQALASSLAGESAKVSRRRSAFKFHGELIAHGWIEYNPGSGVVRPGRVPDC